MRPVSFSESWHNLHLNKDPNNDHQRNDDVEFDFVSLGDNRKQQKVE
jgi:hypothetical protein